MKVTNIRGETLVLFHSDTTENLAKLVEFGLDLNTKDQNDQSILFRLLYEPQKLMSLVRAGVDLNVKDVDGISFFERFLQYYELG